MTTDVVGSEIEGEFVFDGDELSFPHDSRVQVLIMKKINFTFSTIFIARLNRLILLD